MRTLALIRFAGCAFAVASAALADSSPVPLDQVPPAVWKTIQTGTGGIRPKRIERIEDDGEVSYGAAFDSSAGGERAILVAQDGHLLSLEVTLADVPVPVRKTIASQAADGQIAAIDKQVDGDDTIYDVDLALPTGKNRSFSVSSDGSLQSLEITLDEAPDEVQKAIKSRTKGGSLTRIDKVFDAGELSFDVDYTNKQGKEISCSLAANGRLMSVEVLMDELPLGVQATIQSKVGTGKIVRLSKVVGAKHNVQRYEVQSLVDGKAFDFSVGAKGKFLGMDS